MKHLSLSLSFCILAMFSSSAYASIWINEFHYDNAGTDVDEGIEIVANNGTDLDGYQLLLYNGSNGQVYQTILLSGIVTNQQSGFGALYFAISGIQNGPDGMALVDTDGEIIQFLSYEGSFVAAEGAAEGMQSVDISIFENNDAKTGSSLQLRGSGQSYEDFTWVQDASSYGELNSQQIIATPIPLPASLPLLMTAASFLLAVRKRPSTTVPGLSVQSP